MSGFIAMQRDALDHPVLCDAERFRAWFWLLANAAWKPTRTRLKGKIVTLDRGQMTFSVRFLAEAWGWSKSRVDRFLAELRAEGMIATRSNIGTAAGQLAGHGQSVISICNYDKYQDPAIRRRDSAEPQRGTKLGQQRDKEEQGNKGTSNKNKKTAREIPDDFWPSPSPESKTASTMSQWSQDRTEREVERFAAHHQAKGSKFQDWQRAWTTWALSDFQKTGQQNDRSNSDKRDGVAKALDRRLGLDEFAGQAGRQPDRGVEGGFKGVIPRIAAS